jgi:hypothetical protein
VPFREGDVLDLIWKYSSSWRSSAASTMMPDRHRSDIGNAAPEFSSNFQFVRSVVRSTFGHVGGSVPAGSFSSDE